MSIQSPVGTLDIKNATLRVGKLEVSNIQGVDTALNVTRANSVLIYDDQVSTTTFNGFTSSVGVRDTGNGYLDLAGGYVYWGQKLPNSWVMDFEMDIRSGTNAGPLYANVFSTTNTGGDGYSFTFNDSNDKISLYYDSTLLTETTVSGLFTASEDWQKVVINYERGLIAISLDGSRKFYYKDIERETPYVNGEYVSFSSASTDGRKIRDLRIVNGEKWVYSGESNLVYTQGSVGIGVTDPTVALDVSGTVKATAFDGDGSAITNISSANVGDFASNVVRIENLETSNGHIWSNLASNVTILRDEIDSNLATARTDLQSNVTILRGEIDSNLATARTDLQSNVTILRGEIDSNLATARTDLQSNVTILRGEIDSNLATARTDLQSNVTILRDTAITFMGTKTFQDDVVLESNLRVQGDLLVANTVNMTVSDPILELGSNNQNTGDVGLVMTRHGASNSNVAIFFDETADTLKLGYTLNGAGDSTLEFDSNALAVSVQGALTASTGTFSGDVGIGTTAPGYTLDVDGDINFTGTFYQGGSPFVSSLWTDGQDSLYYRSNVEVGTANLFVDTTTSRVGINTITPGYDLDVDGDINFTGNFYQGGSPFVSSEWTTGSESLYYRSNVEIGTANLFVDTTTSRVGINTITPGYDLDVHGTSNVGALTVASVSGNGSGLTSLNATNISSGTINKDRLPGTLNNTTIGSLAIGANDVTLTAKANYHGLKILKAFDSPDEPATLLLSGDGDVFDDIAFEIRGNTIGSSVDTTTTRNSDDTTFGILHTGHTYIGYANLNPGEAGGNSQSGDPMLNVNGAGAFTGDFEVGTANLFVDVSTSNVGIGTTSPAYTLDVHGTSNVGALTATLVSGNGSGLTSLNAGNITSGTLGTARIPNLDASKITTGTLTRPISTTTGTFSGDVAIGTTSPGYKLHVNGTSQFEAEMRWDLGTNVSHAGHGTNKDWYIRSGETAGKVILQDNGGNVGIGTNSPASKLYVDNGVLVVEDTSETNKNLLLPDGDGTGVSLNQHLIGNTHVAVAQFVSEQEANTSTIAIINKDRGENTTKNASIGFYNTDTVGTGKYAGKIGFWPVQADALHNEFRVYTTDTSAGYNYPQQRFVINKDGDVGIGTTNPQAKLDTRGDAVFDTGKDDTTLTGLFNYSSTQRAIDTGIAQAASAGSITASTDINPPPGVAGDVIAKYVNSTTTEIFTSQFTAPSLSIITGDVIYFGVWIYATLDVSVEFFKFGGTNQNTGFTATGNSTWTWYEKTITSTSTTSSPEFRIDNNTAGRTYYFTGFTIRKNPSQTTGLPFTPQYSPASERGPVLSTQTLVAQDVAFNGDAKISGLTYGLKLRGTLDSNKTSDWYRLLVGDIRDGGDGVRTSCKLLLEAQGLHQVVTFDFNHMINVPQSSGNIFNLYGNDHYIQRNGITKLRIASTTDGKVALDMLIDHDVVDVNRNWTIQLYVDGGSSISAPTTFLQKITSIPTNAIELDITTAIFAVQDSGETTPLCINEDGNVGIGTANPTEALSIYRNDANPTYAKIVSNTSDRAGIILSEDNSSNHVIIEYDGTGAGDGNYLSFYSGISGWAGKGTGLNFVPANGNVGIGTASPAYKLDVHGSSNVGALTESSVSGDGSDLTSLNADNLSSGTIDSARLSLVASDIPSLDASKITTGTLGTARIPSLDASKITTGTLTRPIDTTTGTFSGRVDSDRYLTSNTFPLPDPNQHSFRHVCMITSSSVPYGLTQAGGCIYEYNPSTGDTVRVVEPVSEPTAGTFAATAGREYFPMGSPMTIVKSHQVAPFTNLGSLFGFVENRNDPTTAYLYAPYSNVSVEYFHDTSVTGTPTSTIAVPYKTVVSFTCTSASGTNSHIFVVKGGRILMSSTGNGGDDRVLAPLSTIAYGYHNTSFKKDIYLQNDVTTSGKCVYSNQNVPLILSQAGDGDGSDATCGIPFELVADTYIVPHDIRGWMIQFLYTETVVNVAYWSATNSQWEQYRTYSPSGTPSILSPEQLQEGKMGTNDTDINTSHTLWMFTGTKDFTLTVEEYTDNERIVSGFRVHQVAQQIQTNLLDNVVQDSSGNVGIGVTSPDTKFEVFDQTKFNVDVSDATYLKVGNRYSSSDQLSLISAGDVAICSDWNANQTGKNIDFRTNTDTNGGTLLMRIQDDGNVGIGTTSPGYKLHVNGTSQFEAEMRWDLGTRTSHAGYSTNKDWYIRSGETAGNVILQDGGGNVGIGTGSPATLCDLSLASGTDYSNTVALTIRNYSSDYTQIANGFGSRIQFRTNRGTNGGSTSPSADIKGYVYSGAGGTGDYHALDLDVYGDNGSLNKGISILSTSYSGGPANTIMHGNVGIGTADPNALLHIEQTLDPILRIQGTASDSNAYIELRETTGDSYGASLYYEGTSAVQGLRFGHFNGSSTLRTDMAIDRSTGRVGIGTTTPQGLLHLSSGTSGDAHLIIEADTDNNNEADNPKIVFRQD